MRRIDSPDTTRRLYCASCHRVDRHRPVIRSKAVRLILTIATLGAARLVLPYRCVTCGKIRHGG